MTDEEMAKFADMVADRVIERMHEDEGGGDGTNGGGDNDDTVTATMTVSRPKRGKYEKWTEEANAELLRVHAKAGDAGVEELARRRKKSITGHMAQLKRLLKSEADRKRIEELTSP